MITAFENIIGFYASTISDFLMSEPIVYIVAGYLLVTVIFIIKSLR